MLIAYQLGVLWAVLHLGAMLTNSHHLSVFSDYDRRKERQAYDTVAVKLLPETGHFGSHFIGQGKLRGGLKLQ